MKKFIFLLTTLLTMAVATVCFAANDGNDLNKEQKVAAKIIDLIDGEPVPALPTLTADFIPELAKVFDEKYYTKFPKAFKERFGELKEYHFINFERLADKDIIVYEASLTKEEKALLIFVFNKQAKLIEYTTQPIKPQQEAQPAEQKAEN